MKKNASSKIFAAIALFWILIWIVGTAILFILQWWAGQYAQPEALSEEEIQKLIEESGLNIDQSWLWDTNESEWVDWSVSNEDLQFITWEEVLEESPESEWLETPSQE